MRDKCTTIPTVDTGLLPSRPDDWDCFFYRHWALEVRGVLLEFAHHVHQCFDLFRSGCEFALAEDPDVLMLKTGRLTTRSVTGVDHSWTNAEEKHPVFLVLRVKLAHNHVHGSFGGGIQSAVLDLVIVNQVEVGMTAGNGDDLLHLALHDER